MEAIGLLGLAALVIKIVTVFKAVGKDNNMVVTQLLVWTVGILVLFLAAHASIAEAIAPFGVGSELGNLDGASIVLGGLILGSSGSFAYDWKKARDGTDSATEPPLVKSLVPVPDPALSPPVTKTKR